MKQTYLAFLSIFIFSVVGFTQDSNIDWNTRTSTLKRLPLTTPVVIKTGIFLVDITHIDVPSVPIPHFTAEYIISLSWTDSRLIYETSNLLQYRQYHDKEVDQQLEKIWWPEISIPNQDGPRITENKILKISPNGAIQYLEKFKINLKMQSNLTRFPFDEQYFKLMLEIFDWDTSQVKLQADMDFLGMSDALVNDGWDFEHATIKDTSLKDELSHKQHSIVKHIVSASRRPNYYLYKIITPLMLMLFFTWSTFWMVGENASLRLQRLVIAMLAMIAFHQVIISNLPRIGGITFIDAIVYLCFTSVGATVIHLIRYHHLEQNNLRHKGIKMDQRARFIYPLAFGTMMVAIWIYFH
jgi:hypothetical protein